MAGLKDIQSAEKENLTKMERLENEALFFTANKLASAISDAITNGVDDVDDFIDTYAATYTAAMMVSWLLGQVHIIKQIDDTIELSNAPILLAVDPVPFQEAIDALTAMIPTESDTYRKASATMKLRAFTIANVSGLDAVNRVKKLYEDALNEGQSRADVLGNLNAYLEQVGVSEANPYWLELHYRNNMMTAYNAGRWTQIADNDLVEVLVYNSVMDDGTTELCTELNNVAKPKNDPFWEQFYPPNHHKCRGTVSVLTGEQYKKLPANEKEKSESITIGKMHDDDTFSKEHQFRSSPLVSMQALPESLAKSAQDYGLIDKVLSQSYADSKPVIKDQMSQSSQTKVTTSVLNSAIKSDMSLNPFKEYLKEVELADAEDVYYGFDELAGGELMPALQYVIDLDGDHKALMMQAAFGELDVYDVQYFTSAQLAKLVADFVALSE